MKMGELSARALVIGLCFGVAGCGGGGQVSSVSSPPPPSAPNYDSFVGLNKNVTLQTSSSALSYTYNTISGLDPNSVSRDAKGGFGEGGVTISYDAGSQTYTVHDGATAISYAPADKSSTAPGTSQTPFDTYIRRNGNLTDTVLAYRAGTANTQFPQLSYTTFLIADREVSNVVGGVSNANINARVIYAIGGFETVRSDLPKTGTASYSTFVAGTVMNSGMARDVTGTATITADFANAAVNTGLALSYNGQSIGSFTGAAPIDSTTSHFKGDLTAGGATQGSFSGSFFGPQGSEVGYTYRVQTGIGTVDGGVVGKK